MSAVEMTYVVGAVTHRGPGFCTAGMTLDGLVRWSTFPCSAVVAVGDVLRISGERDPEDKRPETWTPLDWEPVDRLSASEVRLLLEAVASPAESLPAGTPDGTSLAIVRPTSARVVKVLDDGMLQIQYVMTSGEKHTPRLRSADHVRRMSEQPDHERERVERLLADDPLLFVGTGHNPRDGRFPWLGLEVFPTPVGRDRNPQEMRKDDTR